MECIDCKKELVEQIGIDPNSKITKVTQCPKCGRVYKREEMKNE